MKVIKTIIILTILFSVFSCEKEEKYPKKYVFSSFVEGALKGYTNSGNISDTRIIANFIQNDFNKVSTFEEYKKIATNTFVEIEILSDSKASITINDSTTQLDLIRKDGIIYFQAKDTTMAFGYTTDENNTSIVKNARFKYAPLYFEDKPIPMYAGIVHLYLPCFYLLESDKELHFMIVSYFEKQSFHKDGNLISAKGEGKYGVNNSFDKTYLDKIPKSTISSTGYRTDTIVYQDSKIIFKLK